MHNSMIFFIQCECHWICVYEASGRYNFLKRINVLGMINPSDLLVFDECLYIPDDRTSRTRNVSGVNSESDHCIWKVQLSYVMQPEKTTGNHPEKMLKLGKWWPWSLSRTLDGKQIIITTTTNKVYFWNPEIKNQIQIETVTLPSIIHSSQHIIELSSSFYLLCHNPWARSCLRKVCVLVRKGNDMHFKDSPSVMDDLDNPRHLAELPDGRIVVVDHFNNRVLVMDKDLNSYTEVLRLKNGGKKRPCRVAYDKLSNLLAVAFHHYVGLYSPNIDLIGALPSGKVI